MSEVSVEDVRRVAELAHLELTQDEEHEMQRDLSAILDHISQLNRLQTDGIPAMAQVSEMLGEQGSAAGTNLRLDVVLPSIPREGVMNSAPDSDGRFFKVPKVIER